MTVMKHTHLTTLAALLSLFCVMQAQAGLSGRFITTFGEISSLDCPWTVRVSDTNQTFQISYRYDTATNSSGSISIVSPSDWRAKPGWFVFMENNERIWAYDGGSSLFLQVAKPGKLGPTCMSYGPHSFPCHVPDEALARLSPEARKAIKSDKR
jgi:hypothetical protein